MDENYKTLKENSILNLTGQDVMEIRFLSLLMPLTIFLYYLFFKNEKREYSLKSVLQEFVFFVLPYPILFLYFNDNNLMFLIIFYLLPLIYVFTNRNYFPFLNDERVEDLNQKRKPFLDTYRATTIMGTSLTILMVDFPKNFPLRYAKTHSFGLSSMDMGVGSFVFSSGFSNNSSKKSIFAILKSIAPVITLGFIRFFSVYFTNYQSIDTGIFLFHLEYGVISHFKKQRSIGIFSLHLPLFHYLLIFLDNLENTITSSE
jgi:glucosaminylphosphatidylinositol acyltransferase